MKRPVICNLNFHTTFGGTQRTLGMVLPVLANAYEMHVVDPYQNQDFQKLMRRVGLSVELVVDLSQQTRLSVRNGPRRLLDYGKALPAYLTAATKLHAYFERIKADLVYVNQTKSAAMAIMAAPRSVPILFHCHDAGSTAIQLIARFNRRLACVVANSPHTSERLAQQGFDRDRVRVVMNAVDVDDIYEQVRLGLEQPLPVSVCRPILLVAHAGIDPNKGTLQAVEAFGEMTARGVPGELWIAGDVSPAQADYIAVVRQRVADMGLIERVHFLGRRNDIYAVMDQADIILMPTISLEPFGRVAVEAMALGKVVIGSNRGALPDLVQDQITGLIFDPRLPGDFARVMAETVIDEARRTQLGQAGAAWVREHFRPDEFNQKMLATFEAILKQ